MNKPESIMIDDQKYIRADSEMKATSYFTKEKGKELLSYLDFNNNPQSGNSGEIVFGAYSYEIDSTGTGGLSKDEARQLFLAMLNYYFATGDKVMVDVRNLLGSTHHVSGN